jgi:hypothetical protein
MGIRKEWMKSRVNEEIGNQQIDEWIVVDNYLIEVRR